MLKENVNNMVRDVGGGMYNFMFILPCGCDPLENLRAVISTTENIRF